jgi:hypothetical protein
MQPRQLVSSRPAQARGREDEGQKQAKEGVPEQGKLYPYKAPSKFQSQSASQPPQLASLPSLATLDPGLFALASSEMVVIINQPLSSSIEAIRNG